MKLDGKKFLDRHMLRLAAKFGKRTEEVTERGHKIEVRSIGKWRVITSVYVV